MFLIRHFGWNVINLEKSVEFYEKLGLQLIYRQDEEWGKYYPTMRIAKMKDPNGSILEFIELKREHFRKYKYSYESHICFTVDDLDHTEKELTKIGIGFVVSPRLSPDKSVKVGFCLDPNGYRVELVEVL